MTLKPAVAAMAIPYPTSAQVFTMGMTVLTAPLFRVSRMLLKYFQKKTMQKATPPPRAQTASSLKAFSMTTTTTMGTMLSHTLGSLSMTATSPATTPTPLGAT